MQFLVHKQEQAARGILRTIRHASDVRGKKIITEIGEKRRRLQSRSPRSGQWRCRNAPAAPQRPMAPQHPAFLRPPPAADRRHEAFAGSGPRCSIAGDGVSSSPVCGQPGFRVRSRYPPCCLPVLPRMKLFKFYPALLIALLVAGLKKRNFVFGILRFTQLNRVDLLRGFLPGYVHGCLDIHGGKIRAFVAFWYKAVLRNGEGYLKTMHHFLCVKSQADGLP